MPFLFQKLDVYQRAVKLAGRMTRLTAEFSSGSYAIWGICSRFSVFCSRVGRRGGGVCGSCFTNLGT